jgi:hypothetical protein
MNHKIKNGLFVLAFSVIVVGLFVMTNSIDNIFAIKTREERIQIRKALLIHLPIIIITKKDVVH